MVANLTAGRDVFRSLECAIRDARHRAEAVRANLDKLDQFIDAMIANRGHSLVELAEHYFPEMSAGTVSRQFVEVRSHLQRLLRKKQEHEETLQRSWDENLDRRSQLEADVDELTGRLDELVRERDALQGVLAGRLKEHDDFQQLSRQVLAAENELKRNEVRVAEMRVEVAAKLPKYEDSRMFQYLFRRGFGTPEYRARGIIRRLDRWVARLVNFNKNRQSYNFLRATPELMSAEVERRRERFNTLMRAIEAIEDAIADEVGLTAILRQGNEVGDRRGATLKTISEVESDRTRIENELSSLEEQENEYYVAGVNRLTEFLGSMEESALAVRTRATPQQKDDAIFREIQSCNQQLRDARQQSREDRETLDLWHEKISGLDDVARQFRSAEFDSRRSFFSRRLNVEEEIDRYLQGQNSVQGLWLALRQAQRFIQPQFDDSWDDLGGVFNSDVSQVLGKVLIEVAGEAMRHAARRGVHRRGPARQTSRRAAGRPPFRRRGGFTSGKGF